jgi:hypothetical protein
MGRILQSLFVYFGAATDDDRSTEFVVGVCSAAVQNKHAQSPWARWERAQRWRKGLLYGTPGKLRCRTIADLSNWCIGNIRLN